MKTAELHCLYGLSNEAEMLLSAFPLLKIPNAEGSTNCKIVLPHQLLT